MQWLSPAAEGRYVWRVRAGRLSLCSRVLLVPLGVSPKWSFWVTGWTLPYLCPRGSNSASGGREVLTRCAPGLICALCDGTRKSGETLGGRVQQTSPQRQNQKFSGHFRHTNPLSPPPPAWEWLSVTHGNGRRRRGRLRNAVPREPPAVTRCCTIKGGGVLCLHRD